MNKNELMEKFWGIYWDIDKVMDTSTLAGYATMTPDSKIFQIGKIHQRMFDLLQHESEE